jgi:hypothetical protein
MRPRTKPMEASEMSNDEIPRKIIPLRRELTPQQRMLIYEQSFALALSGKAAWSDLARRREDISARLRALGRKG